MAIQQASILIKIASWVFLLAFTLGVALPAHADQYNDYFQITCKPEADYFALRALTLWVTECEATKTCSVRDGTSQDSRLYVPESMLREPYICRLQGRTVSVQLVDYIAPHYPGMCGLVAKFKVRIKLGDDKAYDFFPFGDGCPRDEKRHLIEINPAQTAYSYMVDCVLPDTTNPQPGIVNTKTSCTFLGDRELMQSTPKKK